MKKFAIAMSFVMLGCGKQSINPVVSIDVAKENFEIVEEFLDCRAYSEDLSNGIYGECAEPFVTGKGKVIKFVCAPYDRSELYDCFACGDTYSTYLHPLCEF